MSQTHNAPLKTVTYRLQNTPTKRLPAIVPHLVNTLRDCKDVLSGSGQSRKDAPEVVLLHKYKTQINTFLNDKAAEKRWTAVVLIKTTIDIGGDAILQECGSWVRGILTALGKSDPAETKRLCVLTLTRIFLLTQNHPTLIREVTTPSLPQYITQCLKQVTQSTSATQSGHVAADVDLVCAILETFQRLVPHHPTVFRTFVPQISKSVASLCAPTPSCVSDSSASQSLSISADVIEPAQQLFAVLHFSATKKATDEEWTRQPSQIIGDTHSTADRVFRGVIEDWQSAAGYQSSVSRSAAFEGIPEQSKDVKLPLPNWQGVDAGCERLQGLLGLLETFLQSQTASPLAVPLGQIVDLLTRLVSTTVPDSKAPTMNQRPNDQISRDEREALWSHLPAIHARVLTIIETTCNRLGTAALPLCDSMLDIVMWICAREGFNTDVRERSYDALALLLEQCGPALSARQAKVLGRMIKMCCEDIIPPGTGELEAPTVVKANDGKYRRPLPSTRVVASSPSLQACATNLLEVYLSRVQARYMSSALRSLIDRTLVLSGDEHAMYASVLNPPHSTSEKAHSSILPLLARTHPASHAVEGLLRPRMPLVTIEPLPYDGAEGDEDYLEDRRDEPSERTASEQLDNATSIQADGDEQALPIASHDRASETRAERREFKRFSWMDQPKDESKTPLGAAASRHSPLKRSAPSPPPQQKRARYEDSEPAAADHGNVEVVLGDSETPVQTRNDTHPNGLEPLAMSLEQQQNDRETRRGIAALPADQVPLGTDPAGDDSDGSDFVIPPLTLSDSDDEDDDEDASDEEKGEEDREQVR